MYEIQDPCLTGKMTHSVCLPELILGTNAQSLIVIFKFEIAAHPKSPIIIIKTTDFGGLATILESFQSYLYEEITVTATLTDTITAVQLLGDDGNFYKALKLNLIAA